jgi:hypothetical protein
MERKLVVYIAVLFSTSFLKSGLLAQTGQSDPSFVRDASRPFVYLLFDHVGIEPSMSLSYSLYDLPTQACAIISKSE